MILGLIKNIACLFSVTENQFIQTDLLSFFKRMILTGSKIKEEIKNGAIKIEPFSEDQINSNSYNYRLGYSIKVFDSFVHDKSTFKEIDIPSEGYVLEAG